MGSIQETNDDVLGLEERKESFMVCDLQRVYPAGDRATNLGFYREVMNIKSNHIFAYADGEIEITKDFLRRLVGFFDIPENRKKLER